jgi:hypothetical protein
VGCIRPRSSRGEYAGSLVSLASMQCGSSVSGVQARISGAVQSKSDFRWSSTPNHFSWVAFLLDVEVGVGGWSGAVWLDGGACLA